MIGMQLACAGRAQDSVRTLVVWHVHADAMAAATEEKPVGVLRNALGVVDLPWGLGPVG